MLKIIFMKQLRMVGALLLLSITTMAQQQKLITSNNSKSVSESNSLNNSKIYLGLNTGIENPNGLFGVSIDFAPVQKVSIAAGVGSGSWGTKSFVEIRRYLGDNCLGWAGAIGFTHSSGLRNVSLNANTVWGDRTVVFDLYPVNTISFGMYRFIHVGQRSNRFSYSFGYSVRLTNDIYDVKSGDVLSDHGESVMKVMAPGGLMIGLGYYFDVSARH